MHPSALWNASVMLKERQTDCADAMIRLTSKMTSDLDIYRSAAVMIRQFGPGAAAQAAARAGSLGEKGDHEGQFTWERIARAVRDLQRVERPADEPLQ